MIHINKSVIEAALEQHNKHVVLEQARITEGVKAEMIAENQSKIDEANRLLGRVREIERELEKLGFCIGYEGAYSAKEKLELGITVDGNHITKVLKARKQKMPHQLGYKEVVLQLASCSVEDLPSALDAIGLQWRPSSKSAK